MDLKPTIHVELTKEAHKFIEVLISLGYLSSENQGKLYKKLLYLRNNDSLIQLDEVRRCSAEILFQDFEQLPKRLQRFLKSDWKLLFS